MISVKIPYKIGQRVDLKHSDGVEATLVGVQIYAGSVTYLCRWMHNGEYKEQWLSATEIGGKKNQTKIGFGEDELNG